MPVADFSRCKDGRLYPADRGTKKAGPFSALPFRVYLQSPDPERDEKETAAADAHTDHSNQDFFLSIPETIT